MSTESVQTTEKVAGKKPESLGQTGTKADDYAAPLSGAQAIIHRNVLWALGAGIVPIPGLDILAVTTVQLKMLKELSSLYQVKFTEQLAKKLIGSLLAGLGSVGLGVAVGASLTKLIPGLGTLFGLATVPLFAGAFTHATGRVFLMHFESGGTLLDFDPLAVRAHFRLEFEKAREAVAKLQKEQKAAAKPAQ